MFLTVNIDDKLRYAKCYKLYGIEIILEAKRKKYINNLNI